LSEKCFIAGAMLLDTKSFQNIPKVRSAP